MSVFNKLVNTITGSRLDKIDSYSDCSAEIQHSQLLDIVTMASDTEWGASKGYSSIRDYNSYINRVEVQTYEDIEPYIKRMMAGEESVLWPDRVKWFAKSSGTTASKSKFIPITDSSLEECHYRGGKDVYALYFRNNPNSNILSGKGLALGGSHRVSSLSKETKVGDLSAILLENLPFWMHFHRTPEPDIVLLEEFEKKIEKISEVCVDDNVVSIAGVPSWLLVMIQHILIRSGKSNLLEVWPNLELFVHGGINFTPYREQYKRVIPSSSMNYMETYNASEGFFAIQDDPSDTSMLLMLDLGIFYEFIPMSSYGTESQKIVPIWEVELGVNYAMVISTNGGLWRYLIGDTVRFTSKVPYKIVITGRTKYFINAFGEEVIIDNTESALQIACRECGASIREYSAGPVFMKNGKKGRHQWIIEFENSPNSIDNFTTSLDRGLQSLNSDYEAKRDNNATLEQLEIVVAKRDLFKSWMKSRGKLGGQNKVPRLSNDRVVLDSILKHIEVFG